MKNVLIILRHTRKQLNNDIKYQGIINAFRRKGYRVWYTYSEHENIFIDNGEKNTRIGKLGLKLKDISRNTSLYKAVCSFIKDTDVEFEYCYIRSIPALPGYIKMLKAIRRKNIKIAVEIPTYPSDGEAKTETLLRSILFSVLGINEKMAVKYIDVYLPMGELTEKINGVPAVNIENGVDVDLIPERKYKGSRQDEVHMLAVAKIARWHGYDRVIEGLKIYYENNPDIKVYFHIVGPDGDGTLKKYKELVDTYCLNEYVFFEGAKYGDDVESYFNSAEIAFATLGTHRKNIKRISSLKVGEYMAKGIPFVYELSEAQVCPEWEFCMSVPADDTSVDIGEIIKFVNKVNLMDDVSGTMRKIAIGKISWDEQIDRIVNYFEQGKKK